jgi:frataxin-like iron-binding protein CyaY
MAFLTIFVSNNFFEKMAEVWTMWLTFILFFQKPTSGPKRFDYDKEQKCWFYGREGSELMSLLSTEIDKILEDNSFSSLLTHHS